MMSNYVGIAFGILAGISIASMAIFVRMATRKGGDAFTAVIVSLVLNLVIIIPAVAVIYYPEYGITLRSCLAFIGAGMTGTLVGRVLYFEGISRVGASRADAIKATMPIFATMTAIVVLGENPITLHILAIVAVVVGVWIISSEMVTQRGISGANVGKVGDIIYPLGAAIFFGFEPIFARIGVLEGTPAQVGVSIKILIAAVGFLLYFAWKKEFPDVKKFLENRETAKWYILAGLANTAMMIFYYAAIEKAPVIFVVPFLQTSPLFVVIFSYIWIQDIERVSWRLVLGVLVMICAAVTITTIA